jgi:hypothetical protein
MPHTFRRSGLLALLPVLALTALVYAPGLGGGFLLDDYPNLIENQRVHLTTWDPGELWQASQAGTSGRLGRPVAMLSFALNHLVAGLDPFYLKVTNLVIHLFCGVGILILTRILLAGWAHTMPAAFTEDNTRWIALATASIWLLHPLNLTPVLYTVQRMTSLSALFVVLGMAGYAWGRMRMLTGRPGLPIMVGSLAVAGPLAVLSKENGALLPLFIALIELTVFRLAAARSGARGALLAFLALVVVLPLVILAIRLGTDPRVIVGGYEARSFSLGERLLTEARALWFYIRLLLVPDVTQMGLHHDDFSKSVGWLEPPTSALAVGALVLLLAGAWWARRGAPWISFGILFFLVGHSMESSVIALELVHEHRNYLPGYGPVLALVVTLLRTDTQARLPALRRMAAVVFTGLLALGTGLRANIWGDPLHLVLTWSERQPRSIRAQYEAGRYLAGLYQRAPEKDPHLYRLAREYITRASLLDQQGTVSLAALVLLEWHAERPIDPGWVAKLEQRLGSEPIGPSSTQVFAALIRCSQAADCPLDGGQMTRLFEAAVANPRVSSRLRAHLHDLYARYQALVVEAPASAVFHMRRAVTLAPGEIQHRLNLVELLIAYDVLDTARDELDTARERDPWRTYSPRIAALESKLAQRQPSPP